MKKTKMVTTLVLSMFTLSLAALSSTPAFGGEYDGYAAPTGLNAWVDGVDDVALSWDAYSAFPSDCTKNQEIRILRDSTSSGSFTFLIAVEPTDTTYIDMDLNNGTYAYKIQAKCNVPVVPGQNGHPAYPNNFSLMSNTASVDVASAPQCAGPPTVNASATPTSLWPPNGKQVAVTVTGTVTPQSNCSLPENISYFIVDEYGDLSSITPVTVTLQGDGTGTFSFPVNLESSRRGDDLDGRLYTIEIDTPDEGAFDINVTVPHDQRKK